MVLKLRKQFFFYRDSYYYLKKNGCTRVKEKFNCNLSFHKVLCLIDQFGVLLNCLLPLVIGPCVLPFCVLLLNFFHAVDEVAQISVHRLHHFKSKENCLDISVIVLTLLLFAIIPTG